MAVLDLDLDPSARVLRVFGAGALIAFGGLAALGAGPWDLPRALWLTSGGLALIAGALALVRPAWNRPLYWAVSVLTYPVGLVLSYAVLGVLFYLVLTPTGLAFRLLGRDPLRRRRTRDASTYWVPSGEAPPLERYLRQF